MTIIWYVEDGYIRNGPHKVEVDDTELEGLSTDEQNKVIEEYIQDDFNQIVSFHWKREDD